MRESYTLKVSSADPDLILVAYQRAFTIMPRQVSPFDHKTRSFTVTDMTDGPKIGPGRNVFSEWCKRNQALSLEKIWDEQNEKLAMAK